MGTCVNYFLRGDVSQVVVEPVIATIDHSDIRGFGYPHAHDPSGAASDPERRFGYERMTNLARRRSGDPKTPTTIYF
jgi:hypothetical protein